MMSYTERINAIIEIIRASIVMATFAISQLYLAVEYYDQIRTFRRCLDITLRFQIGHTVKSLEPDAICLHRRVMLL